MRRLSLLSCLSGKFAPTARDHRSAVLQFYLSYEEIGSPTSGAQIKPRAQCQLCASDRAGARWRQDRHRTQDLARFEAFITNVPWHADHFGREGARAKDPRAGTSRTQAVSVKAVAELNRPL